MSRDYSPALWSRIVRAASATPTTRALRTVDAAVASVQAAWKSRILSLTNAGLLDIAPRLHKSGRCPVSLDADVRTGCNLPICPWCWARGYAASGGRVLAAITAPPKSTAAPPPALGISDDVGAHAVARRRIRSIERAAPKPLPPDSPRRDLIARRARYTIALADAGGRPLLSAMFRNRLAYAANPDASKMTQRWRRRIEWRRHFAKGVTGGYETMIVRPSGIVPRQAGAGWTFDIVQLILTPKGQAVEIAPLIGLRANAEFSDSIVSADAISDYVTAVAKSLAYPRWMLTADPGFVRLYLAARVPDKDNAAERMRFSAPFGEVRGRAGD